MKLKIDEMGRFCIPKEVRETLNLKCGDTRCVHAQQDRIVINGVRENAYSIVRIDELNRMPISIDLVRHKLKLNAGDEFTAEFENGEIVIPLNKEQQAATIRYIRRLDEFNRSVLPRYIRDNYDMPVGSPVRYDSYKDGKYLMKQDTEHNIEFFKIDDIGRVVVPAAVADTSFVEFSLTDDGIIIDKVCEQ